MGVDRGVQGQGMTGSVDVCAQLSEGQEVYVGPAAEAAAHFEALGHPCPPHYNPAEFYADLISVDPTNPDTEQRTRWAKFWVTLQAGGLQWCDLSCGARKAVPGHAVAAAGCRPSTCCCG